MFPAGGKGLLSWLEPTGVLLAAINAANGIGSGSCGLFRRFETRSVQSGSLTWVAPSVERRATAHRDRRPSLCAPASVPRIQGLKKAQRSDDDQVEADQVDHGCKAAFRPRKHRNSNDESNDARQCTEPAFTVASEPSGQRGGFGDSERDRRHPHDVQKSELRDRGPRKENRAGAGQGSDGDQPIGALFAIAMSCELPQLGRRRQHEGDANDPPSSQRRSLSVSQSPPTKWPPRNLSSNHSTLS